MFFCTKVSWPWIAWCSCYSLHTCRVVSHNQSLLIGQPKFTHVHPKPAVHVVPGHIRAGPFFNQNLILFLLKKKCVKVYVCTLNKILFMLSQILNHAWHPGVRDLILKVKTFSSVTFEVEPLLHPLMVEYNYFIFFKWQYWLFVFTFFQFCIFWFFVFARPK